MFLNVFFIEEHEGVFCSSAMINSVYEFNPPTSAELEEIFDGDIEGLEDYQEFLQMWLETTMCLLDYNEVSYDQKGALEEMKAFVSANLENNRVITFSN